MVCRSVCPLSCLLRRLTTRTAKKKEHPLCAKNTSWTWFPPGRRVCLMAVILFFLRQQRAVSEGEAGHNRVSVPLCVFLFPLPFFVSFFKQAQGITVTASCKWRGTSRSFPRPPRCGCLGSNESPRGGAMTFLELLPTARGRQPTWVCLLEPRHYFSCPSAWHDLEQVASRCVRIDS